MQLYVEFIVYIYQLYGIGAVYSNSLPLHTANYKREFGDLEEIRTLNRRIDNPMHYQLCYEALIRSAEKPVMICHCSLDLTDRIQR